MEKWQNSLAYRTNLFNYSLNALPVSPWACFSPAIATSHLPTNCRIFSVPVCYTRKMLLEVAQYDLSLPCVQTWRRCWLQGPSEPSFVSLEYSFWASLESVLLTEDHLVLSQWWNFLGSFEENPYSFSELLESWAGGKYPLPSALRASAGSQVTHSGNPLLHVTATKELGVELGFRKGQRGLRMRKIPCFVATPKYWSV